MTPDRSAAYGRVVRTLTDLGPAKLQDAECESVRSAADALLFAAGHDAVALNAITVIERLARHLVETGRWTAESAKRLADDVTACGPAFGDVPVPTPVA